MKKIKILSIVVLLGILFSCKDYLDVVPDNVATIDNAFANRNEAEKYLSTCYSYLPRDPDPWYNPAMLAGDEFWTYWPIISNSVLPEYPQLIARGSQNIVAPYLNYWDGEMYAKDLYNALRDCNIFLNNIDKPVDLEEAMKTRWIGEVQFLKAYYHFYLLRMYGPVPIVKNNLDVTANTDEVRVYRDPVDSVFNYIVSLLDTAATKLPDEIENKTSELGRITRPIALAIKARVLVTAASPLFNGNSDYVNLENPDGTQLFNITKDDQKWVRAAIACKEAIDACETAGNQLYNFSSALVSISDTLRQQMSIRNAVCEKWNEEIIWGYSNSTTETLQRECIPRLDENYIGNELTLGQMAPTLKMAEMFYTNNGVPITEDKTWNYADRYQLNTATVLDENYLQTDYQTVNLHFNREPRFYADLAFDGSKWYMQNGTWDIQAKYGQNQARKGSFGYSITGYFTKKLVNWKFEITSSSAYSYENYSWPMMRMGDLYLLYAEALNEAYGPTADAYTYINKIRTRAGLKSVEESWTNYSNKPTKYTTQSGLREIIHQERAIELAFEGSRFWDLRRWKEAASALNASVRGWNIDYEDANSYYRPVLLFNQEFVTPRDYLWPIKEYDISVNPNLIQNIGW
jgi:starch-binding outer membrane protein, SusD/RagB family